jgi:hypothetical protein
VQNLLACESEAGSVFIRAAQSGQASAIALASTSSETHKRSISVVGSYETPQKARYPARKKAPEKVGIEVMKNPNDEGTILCSRSVF